MPPPASASKGPAPAELESFLVNFVVEQTGYPPEVVDLDADLEADLGIDSIKKAQLFGELQEYFDVSAGGNLSLDDFPTLRHVLSFLQSSPGSVTAPALATPTAAQQTMAPAAPISSTSAVTPEEPTASTAAPTQARSADELQSFLINFVVEQTGYPPEVVDLDADLEADLGIDSIKKAQLFGELQEYFDIGTSTGNLSLDDFPTLRHVLDFLAQASSPALNGKVSNAPMAVNEAPATTAVQSASVTAPAVANANNPAELESFLINFVVEQTGYPPEVVDLDADLEADLGIDSIKKAQLFGELQEYFDIGTSAGNLSLDDFPTLRHVLNFLSGASHRASNWTVQQTSATADPAPAVADIHQQAPALALGIGTTTHIEATAAPESRVARTPYDVGWAHGGKFKAQIRRTLRDHAERIGDRPDDVNGLGIVALHETLSADELDELQGIADAAEVPLGNLLSQHVPADRCENGRIDEARQVATPGSAPAELPAASVTSRFVLEMRDAPLSGPIAAAPNWSGAAIVFGSDRVADALRRLLEHSGVRVHCLAPDADLDTLFSELERICAAGSAPHLFITTGRDALPTDPYDEQLWSRRRHEAMLAPLFLCQKWIQLATAGKWLDGATLVAINALGGNFGFERGTEAAAGGALAGLLKAIFIEYTVMQEQSELRVKVVDAPLDADAQLLTENVFRELASGNLDYEVAFDGNRRRVPFAVERQVTATGTSGIREGAVWVVTGGARGITAQCALELGRRFGLKLNLIGTTAPPEIDPSWRHLSVEGLQQLKAQVMIAARKAGEPAAQAWERVQKNLEIDRSLALLRSGWRARPLLCVRRVEPRCPGENAR